MLLRILQCTGQFPTMKSYPITQSKVSVVPSWRIPALYYKGFLQIQCSSSWRNIIAGVLSRSFTELFLSLFSFNRLGYQYYIEIAYYKEIAWNCINELLCSGHLHNHHPGQEIEFCQQPRTPPPTPSAPCWVGHFLSPHSSDSVPRFYL